MMLTGLFYLFSFLSSAHLSPTLKNGYTVDCLKCHPVDNEKLNIHLVPHSHDDVGWLKTLDQYYYGLNNSIQHASVQYIITSVVDALLQNSDRRYMQVETAFFWKWWNDQTPSMQNKFKSLVDNGQIEMVNGGWSMNDEACTNYQSTIDQFTWGLRLINETVGSCGTPRVGWQIDPFGHSREQASVFSQLGFDGLFFARLDFADQFNRQANAASEYIWHGSSSIEIDFYHVHETVQKYYRTKNIFVPMGSDFQFSAAEANFINMDRLIKVFGNDSELNIFYSTPSCYIKAVNDAQPALPEKFDDFFPYSNDAHSYWAGYFTSRPNSKRFERICHGILQATKQLYAFASYNSKTNKFDSNLKALRESLGTIQHHDAITGTEKQHVANDYVRQLTIGVKDAEKGIGPILKDLIKTDKNIDLDLSSCLLSNISICAVSQQSDKFVAVVYNPLAWNVTDYIRLPVDTSENDTYQISGPNGNETCEIVPALNHFDFVKIPGQKPSINDLVFQARDIPPLGFQIYYIEKTTTNGKKYENLEVTETHTYGWADNNFTVDTSTSLLKSISLNGTTLNVEQNFMYYISYNGSDKTGKYQITSGAYLFRPNGTANSLTGKVVKSTDYRGNFVQEFHQKWSDSVADITQIIRVYKDQSYIEFDWMVGNIDLGDDPIGKEIISKFTITDFNNTNTFYTDSNGREMLERVKDYRADYDYNITAEPVASNYYPVTSNILIRDEKRDIEFAVLNDRSQGGTSLENGVVELMVHRRLPFDDAKGVDEPLNETEFGSTGVYVRGSHYLVFGQASDPNSKGLSTVAQERILAQKKNLPPWIGLASTNASYTDLADIVSIAYPGLSKPLPENVNVLTFEPWKDDTFILRLENIFEKDEATSLSSDVTVSLKELFKNFKIKEYTETTLGANTKLEDIKKRGQYSWKTKESLISPSDKIEAAKNMDIILSPMQIRTFIVKLGPPGSFGLMTKPSFLLLSLLITFILRF